MRSSASVLWMLLAIALLAVRTSPAEAQDPSSAADRLDIIKETQNPLTRELAGVILENSVAFGLGSTDEVGYALHQAQASHHPKQASEPDQSHLSSGIP